VHTRVKVEPVKPLSHPRCSFRSTTITPRRVLRGRRQTLTGSDPEKDRQLSPSPYPSSKTPGQRLTALQETTP
jgi:hypothetical protein